MTVIPDAKRRVVSPFNGGPMSGTSGVWTDVTPAGINLDPTFHSNDNFGLMDVWNDPVRPPDFYAFVCYQGVWKSTDYGLTFTKVSGTNLDMGKPWGCAVETSPTRNPFVPPVLYAAVSNFFGVQKSTDGGATWAATGTLPVTDQDAYAVAINPYDSQHLLAGFHEEDGLAESTNGGATWSQPAGTPATCVSTYPFFIDTGSAATTRQTWIIMGQSGEGATYRTTNQGTSFTQVSTLAHEHGNCQIYQDLTGNLWLGGAGGPSGDGIYKSTDYGVTWARVEANIQNSFYGTANYVYGLRIGNVDPNPMRAARPAGSSWATYSTTPGTFLSCAKTVGVSTDGTRWVTVGGMFNSGIWRYIE